MTILVDAVVELAADTPLERARQLAIAIADLPDRSHASRLDNWPLTPYARVLLNKVATAWQNFPLSPGELAGLLTGASAAYHHAKAQQQVRLVWTGPPSSLIATRNTQQVLLEVIEAAQKRLFVTSFVAYRITAVMEAFARAIARGVELSLLLEPSELEGGGLSFDAIGPVKRALPRARIFTWALKEGRFVDGKVHAKIAVADETVCFVSSANLTQHAMDKNMEAGVLIHGGNVPRDLQRHLQALVTTRVVAAA